MARRQACTQPAGGYEDSINCHFYASGGFLDQRGHSFWLRHVDRVTALDLDDGRARALGHELLGRWRDHLVVGCDQIPARFASPRRFADCAVESLDSPRHLASAMKSAFSLLTSAAKLAANFDLSRAR